MHLAVVYDIIQPFINKKSWTQYQVLQIKSREHRPCFFSIYNVRHLYYNSKQKGGEKMREYLKITKDTERRCFIENDLGQLIYLNWYQILQIIDLMIYKQTNSTIYLDPNKGDEKNEKTKN